MNSSSATVKSPQSICLLRLSALGDATHVVPLVRTLQRGLPGATITWVIGKGEAKLLEGLDGVEFIVHDKRAGRAGFAATRDALKGRRFDALLQLQLALRANLLSTLVRADRRIGYDKARSKEGHGFVVNERIRPGGHHVLDVIGRFCEPLGLQQDRVEWRLPVAAADREWAAAQLPGDVPTLLVSPCSSHPLRNWAADRYAAVADHAAAQGWRIVLSGGRSRLERDTADAIAASMKSASAIDLVGKDTLKQALALYERATLVLGLHACTDAERSGAYSDRRWSVNRYDEAARRFLDKPASALPWGKRVELPGVMDLVTVDEVVAKFEAFRAR